MLCLHQVPFKINQNNLDLSLVAQALCFLSMVFHGFPWFSVGVETRGRWTSCDWAFASSPPSVGSSSRRVGFLCFCPKKGFSPAGGFVWCVFLGPLVGSLFWMINT